MKLTHWPQPIDACEVWLFRIYVHQLLSSPHTGIIHSPSISLPQERVRWSKTSCEVLFLHECHTHRCLFWVREMSGIWHAFFCWNQARFQRCKNRFNLACWEWSYYNHPPTKEQETCHPSSRLVPGPLGWEEWQIHHGKVIENISLSTQGFEVNNRGDDFFQVPNILQKHQVCCNLHIHLSWNVTIEARLSG